MEVNHLDVDEFELECTLRDIQGKSLVEKLDNLKERLTLEASHSQLIPIKAHVAARKNPKIEIRKVSLKLKSIYFSIQNSIEKKDNESLIALNSRLIHVLNRLKRLSYSKTVAEEVADTMSKCDHLIEFVIKTMENKPDVNESLEQFKAVEFSLDDLEEDHSDSSISSQANHMRISDNRDGHAQHSRLFPPANNPNLDSTSFSNIQPDNVAIPIPFGANTGSTSHNPVDLRINAHTQPDYPQNLLLMPNSNIPTLPPYLNNPNAFVPVTTQNYFVPPSNINVNTSIPPPNMIMHGTSPITQLAPSNRYPSVQFNKNYQSRKLMTKWKISFDGSPTGLHIKKFLFMVEYQAKADGIEEAELVRDFSYVLKGTACNWYWDYIQRNPTTNWPTLKHELKKRFQDRRSDLDVRRQLDSRKQKPGEKFLDFYQEMVAISLQAECPISDSELLYILHRNMRAGLQERVLEYQVDSLDSLVRRCVAYEDVWQRTGILPELLCQQRRVVHEINFGDEFSGSRDPRRIEAGTQVNNNYEEEVMALQSHRKGINQPDPRASFHKQEPSGFENNIEVCWNCGRSDHFYKKCPIPQNRIFCFGCGLLEVLYPKCRKCNSNSGNLHKGVRNLSLSTPIQSHQNSVHLEESSCNTDPEFYSRFQKNKQTQ